MSSVSLYHPGRAKETDKQCLSLTDKDILQKKIKMATEIKCGTVYKN